MSTKGYVFVLAVIFPMLVGILVQQHIVNKMKNGIIERMREQRIMEGYILSSCNLNLFQEKAEISELCRSYLNDSDYVVYLPSGLCRACFSSLLFAFHDLNISGNRITVISDREDIEVKSECYSHGIQYLVNSVPNGQVSDIMLFRMYRGFFPIVLDYNLGRESLLSLFLSDDERLLQVLSGTY